jgi:hypothetical protein
VAGALAVVLAVGGVFAVKRWSMSPPERLIADHFFRPGTLYHVADLQERPGVTTALSRLRAANICDLTYSLATGKSSTPNTQVWLCAEAGGERTRMRLEDDALGPEWRLRPGFAVFSADDGAQYLIAHGKHGHVGADEMEGVVVGAIDAVIAAVPVAMEAERAKQASSAEVDARTRAAQQTFK